MNPENNNQSNVPDLSSEEYTMPKESFGGTMTETSGSRKTIISLSILLVILLMILGALFVWGEQIIETVMSVWPDSQTEEFVPTMDTATTTAETATSTAPADDLSAIQAELANDAELQALDAELTQIDTELEGSATATTTASSTAQ